MAKAIAKCRCKVCGCEFTKVAYKNNRAEADNFEEWARENFDTCPDCYKRSEEEQKQKDSEKIGLVALEGSEKQVAWATKIRLDIMSKAKGVIANCEESVKKNPALQVKLDVIKNINSKLANETSAKFWIDNRSESFMSLVSKMYKIGENK